MSIEKLWNEKRWLFYILFPLILLLWAARIWNWYNTLMAGKAMADARKEDSELQDKIDEIREDLDTAEEEVQDIQDTIDDLEVDDDWNKNI